MASHASRYQRKTGAERTDEEVEADLRARYGAPTEKNGPEPPTPRPEPEILNLSQIEELKLPQPKQVIEGRLVTTPGVYLLLGAQKAGKTVLAVQFALNYHAGASFLNHYRMLESRTALVIEQDDPDRDGLAAVQDIVRVYTGVRHPDSFIAVRNPDFVLGEGFTEWLEKQITSRDIGLVVLDSYTKMRARRRHGGDIVREETDDFDMLNALAKRANCLILVLHHPSNAGFQRDWDQQAAGTYGIGMAVDGYFRISRFRELAINAPERLLQVRGRRSNSAEMVLRFIDETLSYERVMEGSASPYYPDVLMFRRQFSGRLFSPKDVEKETGMGRSTVHKVLNRLLYGNVLSRCGYGEYRLSDEGRS